MTRLALTFVAAIPLTLFMACGKSSGPSGPPPSVSPELRAERDAAGELDTFYSVVELQAHHPTDISAQQGGCGQLTRAARRELAHVFFNYQPGTATACEIAFARAVKRRAFGPASQRPSARDLFLDGGVNRAHYDTGTGIVLHLTQGVGGWLISRFVGGPFLAVHTGQP